VACLLFLAWPAFCTTCLQPTLWNLPISLHYCLLTSSLASPLHHGKGLHATCWDSKPLPHGRGSLCPSSPPSCHPAPALHHLPASWVLPCLLHSYLSHLYLYTGTEGALHCRRLLPLHAARHATRRRLTAMLLLVSLPRLLPPACHMLPALPACTASFSMFSPSFTAASAPANVHLRPSSLPP